MGTDDMGTITKIDWDILEKGSYDPRQFFKVLNTEEYFKQFKKELLDRVQKVENPFVVEEGYGERVPIPNVDTEDAEEKDALHLTEAGEKALVDWLLGRLKGIDPDDKWGHPSIETVKDWIHGATRPYYGKEDPTEDGAMKICFALGLNHEEAADFLSRGGIAQRAFDPRDAHQTAYQICLMKGRPYSDAMEAIERFEKYRAENPPEASPGDDSTQTLLGKLEDSDSYSRFATQDAIVDYLIENRTEYERESLTVWKCYLRVRAKLCMVVVERQLRWSQEEAILDDAVKWLEDSKDLLADNERVEALLQKMHRVQSSAYKHDDASQWQDMADDWRAIADDFLYDPTCGTLSARSLLAANRIYDRTLASGRPKVKKPNAKDNSAEVLTSKKSSFPLDRSGIRIRGFLSYFPTNKELGRVDRGPGAQGFSIGLARKAIVTLFFFDYAYRWLEANGKKEATTYGFEDFQSELNTTLTTKCRLSPLYASDACDMLVMKSIMAYDPACNKTGSLRSPVEFFNWVVAESFCGGESEGTS